MFRKNMIFILTIFLVSIASFANADYTDNVETAYVFINSVVFDQKGAKVLDFTNLYDLENQFPTSYKNAVNVSSPANAVGCNFNNYATVHDGGSIVMVLPYYPFDAQQINVYFGYRRRVKKGKGKSTKWEYVWDVERITPSKEGVQIHTFKNQNKRGNQEIVLEVRGREVVIRNHGQAVTGGFLWWKKKSELPMYLQVVEMKNVKIPRSFPKIAVDGNHNIYNVLRKKGNYKAKGNNLFGRELFLEVYKNGSSKMFEVSVGEEIFRQTGANVYEPAGERLNPVVSLSINPQADRIYLHSNLPSSLLYTYDIANRQLKEQKLGFTPKHMRVSTKNREEDWIHYSMAEGLSVAETWGPEQAIEDNERFELYRNKVYKTRTMNDIFNNQAQDGGYVNISKKDVYGETLLTYAPGEGFAYSNTGANTSAEFALGNTPDSWTAMGRRANMSMSMGVDISKGKEIIVYERSNFKVDNYKFPADSVNMRFTTKEGEDYRITRDGKSLHIVDVGKTPMKQVQKRKKKWIIWPIWYKWEYYTEWVVDPVLNDPTNFGLTAFYNIAMVKVTEVPFEDIQYFAADGYGNKYTVRRKFGDYENWKSTGSIVRHGTMVKYYKRKTYFTLYKLDINNNETELFTSPNIGESYYYRTGAPWPPGSCGCQGVRWSDYIPIYEAAAEADLATNNYSMPPRVVGVPIVDIKVTPTDAPRLQMLGVTGELFMDISENQLISDVVAPSNNVTFENYDGVEWGHKFLGSNPVPAGKRAAPAGVINTHNPYMFTPNEYYFRANVVEIVNKDIDGDANFPDGPIEPGHKYSNLDWAVSGGGFPSDVVLGRHKYFSGAGDINDPRVDSRYYVWSIRRLAIYNETMPEGQNLLNAETPWTVINHGARDYTNNAYAKKILSDTGMGFVPNEEFLNKGRSVEGFRFQPGGYRFDDGGVYEIMLAAGYRYIDWDAMRAESDAGRLKFWWDEPEYIKEAAPMKPDIERVIVRAYQPEDRPNLLHVVIDGDTTDAPDYDQNKMMSYWQYYDHDGDGIPNSAVVELNEDFDHRWTMKIIQKDRYGNIVSDNQDILFVPNRMGQQEVRDIIEPDDPYKEENLEIADKFSGVAFESSGGVKMNYEWKVETIVDGQVFDYNYYNHTKAGNFKIDNPALDGHNRTGAHYQPDRSRVQEEEAEGFILGQDSQRRPSYFNTYFDTPLVPNHYRITFTMYYTRIDYFDDNGNFAYPLTDEHGEVIGYDCKETIEKTSFFVDVYVKDITLPYVRVEMPIMDGGTTGDPYPREIRAFITDNNPFDGITENEYNNLLGTLGNDDYTMIPPGTRSHLIYPRRIDPERTPVDLFNFEEAFDFGAARPDNSDGWKWERPSMTNEDANSFLKVRDVLTAYEAPGVRTSSYEVVLPITEENLKLIMPFDAMTDDVYGSFKYVVIAEDGMRNYYENARNTIRVYTGAGHLTTTFRYPGDTNAHRQLRNYVHFEEDTEYIERHATGVPYTMPEPGMLTRSMGEAGSFIADIELNPIFPRENAGTYFADDDGEFLVYKQAGGPAESGYYGMAEGEIVIEDNDPPEVYIRVTNPKRNITIGYYLYDHNHINGVSGNDDRLAYPFRDETEYDENIPGLIALEREESRGKLALAVGGGDYLVYADPEIIELPKGYPEEPGHMITGILPWFGEGFAPGGGLLGGVKDSNDFNNMLIDFERDYNMNTLFIEEDMRIKIEIAAVDNINNPYKAGGETPLMMSLAGEWIDGMLHYASEGANSAVYITNLEDGTGATPNVNWDRVSTRAESGRISDYCIFRESTRDDAPDELMYVRVKDHSDNEVLFAIPIRILNVRVLERKIYELRQEHGLGQ
ncbi:MAG: hypothetical protein WC002_01480 [Candidatus Muiribacteriota bacterium]